MTAQEELSKLYDDLLEAYSGGFSNTSTRKFESLNAFFAKLLGLKENDVYSVSAGTRTTNLPIRLVQGRQANRHTTLGLGWVEPGVGESVQEVAERARTSITNYVEAGRGNYDAIGLIAIGDEEPNFVWLMEAPGGTIGKQLKKIFPDLQLYTYPHQADRSIGNANKGQPPGIEKSHIQKKSESVKNATADVSTLVSEVHAALGTAGLRFSLEVVHRFCAALTSKRFVILSGLSGSGKTRFAEAFSSWISKDADQQVMVVPVGADWTSTANMLGYADALDPSRYESTPAVELLVRAARPENSDLPFFLILDEMNLSHVERYFSDFLSAIERSGKLELYAGDPRKGVPGQLPFPENVFVVGTVNVDETTYQFSPKVLDRASVIEFRAGAEEMKAVLADEGSVDIDSVAGSGSQFGGFFLKLAQDPQSLGPEDHEWVAEHILLLYRISEAARKEFGYRTAAEMMRFAATHARLAPAGWNRADALDAQVLQKILPRLAGSRAALERFIWALAAFAFEEQSDTDLDSKIIEPMIDADLSLDPLALGEDGNAHSPEAAFLPLSFAKLLRMADRVREGFVSFFDA